MKMMILLSRVPYPLEKGDKLRAYHQIKRLAQHHNLILCCLNDKPLHPEALEQLTPLCDELVIIKLPRWKIWLNVLRGFFSKEPLQMHYFYHKKAQEEIDHLIEKHLPKHIFCQLVRVTEYVRKYTIIPKTLDYMDALSKGVERRIEKAPFYFRPFVQLEARRLAQYEQEVFADFENHVIISEQDKQLIDHPRQSEIAVIPNGVDLDFFKPQESTKEYELVFTGNMSYQPNVESARFIAQQILPLVRKSIPNARVLISGANPAPAVKSLASKSVTVSGWVADIRDSYACGTVFLAPMQIGTGLQNKLLEAMAMKLPCVTSELANNALGALPGKSILIGYSTEDYAEKIVQLLRDDQLRANLAQQGYDFVRQVYNWDQTSESLNQLMLGAHQAAAVA